MTFKLLLPDVMVIMPLKYLSRSEMCVIMFIACLGPYIKSSPCCTNLLQDMYMIVNSFETRYKYMLVML